MAEQGFFFAFGVAIIFGFLLYAVRAMPRSLAWIGIAAGIAVMALDIANLRAYAWPTVVAFIGVFCLVGAGLWVQHIRKEREQSKLPQKPADINLVVECSGSGIPSTMFPNWEVHVILVTKKGEFQSSGYVGMTPQQAGIFPPDKKVYFGYRCQITNYGSVPVFRIRVSIPIKLFDIIPDPKDNSRQTSAKEPRISGDLPLLIQKIDAGPEHAFTFFIFNLTPMFGTATFPSNVMADILGRPNQSFALTHQTLAGMSYPLSLPPLGN
jgi:hypothetical protein